MLGIHRARLLLCVTYVNVAFTRGLEFVAYGDWGADTSALQRTISTVDAISPDRKFVLLLGDNAYPAGIKDVNDSHFQIFDKVTAGSAVPHHLVLGNHDYLGSVSAQFAYSNIDPRWDLPSRYYKRTYDVDGVKICLLFLDTVQPDQAQLDWLDQSLQGADCNTQSVWTVVVGHYPIWSTGLYSDSDYLKANLVPLLHKHSVQLYLCGHEHLHEVFYDGSVVQVTSGAAADPRSARTFKRNDLQVWGVSGSNIEGFVRLVASPSRIDVYVTSSRSRKDFINFSLKRDPTKESMFGHINWTYTDSNSFAYIAGENGADFTGRSFAAIACILVFMIV